MLLIVSVCEYWTGSLDKKIKEASALWLPVDLDAIPLRIWDPSDNQMVVFLGDELTAVVSV